MIMHLGVNKILVESENDEIVYKALCKKFNNNLDVEFKSNGGIDDINQINNSKCPKLEKALSELKEIIKKNSQIFTIGFLFDLDEETVQNRIQYINNAINIVFDNKNVVQKINTKYAIDFNNSKIYFCCYFINVNGKGNIETLLKSIAKKDKKYADCLSEWKECLIFNGVEINDSDFNKFWLNIYIRYDTCTNQDSKHADKNCSLKNFEKLIEKDIFDLEHNNLDELKSFFKCFV